MRSELASLSPAADPARAALAAREAARAAARRSEVRIAANHDQASLDEAYRVVETVWQPEIDNPPITRALLRALTHGGNYLGSAYDGSTMVGICMGFFAAPLGHSMHSHITGVTPQVAGRHVGYALKLDQRAWALEHGVTHIEWTFDPVVRRNAFFNTAKLAALPTEYLVDFYGDMTDGINAGQGSDRLLASWDLLTPRVVDACGGRSLHPDMAALLADGAQLALDERAGAPSRPDAGLAGGEVLLVRVPEDVETLRRRNPGLAREWRLAVRDTLGTLMQRGAIVTGVSRDGWYVVETSSR